MVFIATVLVASLVDDGFMTDDQKAALVSAGMLPWLLGNWCSLRLLFQPWADGGLGCSLRNLVCC